MISYDESFFPRRLNRMSVSYSEPGAYVPTLADFAYFCDDAGRTSPRTDRRAGPPRVPSRQAGTVAEEANEKVRLESRKGPPSAESARFPLLKRHDSAFRT